MKNKRFFMGILGFWLVFGLFWTGCEQPTGNKNVTTYTVSFNSNGGNSVPSQTVKEGETATRPGNPSRSEYTFDNWYSNSDLTTVYNFSSPVTGDITLYAKWNPIFSGTTYTVTFNSNGGSTVPSQTVNEGQTATRPTNPSRSNYTFDNWYSNSGLTAVYNFNAPVTGDITLYAKWNPGSSGTTYTVTFNSNGGSTVPGQTVNEGQTATRPANPNRSNYTFDNWYSNSGLTAVYNFNAPVTGNITLYAKWNPVSSGTTYTVTFQANGGNGTPPVSQTVSAGTTITLPGQSGLSYPNPDYIFRGWADSETLVYHEAGSSYTVNKNVTFLAYWQDTHVVTYTVTFNSNGGSSIPSQTVNPGNTAASPADPSRSGYTFAGWYSDYSLNTRYNFNTSVYYDITLYAKWNLAYTVTFNSNGGSTVQSQTVNSGETATQPNNPTRNGYTFDNWYSDTYLTTVYNFSTPVTGNITLYANWLQIIYTITFDSNGGSAVESQTMNYGDTVSSPSDPTRDGYTFDGWYSDSDLTTVYDFSTPVTSNITLYAKWNPIPTYTVTFNSNEGSSVSSQTVYVDTVADRPAKPTRSGYTFVNWYSNSDLTTMYDFSIPITADITLYAKWYEQGSFGIITISFTPDAAPVITGPTIYLTAGEDRPATAAITVENPSQYSSIKWSIPGTSVSASGASITLDAANPAYNTAGERALTVEVIRNGVPYGRTIIFTVEQ